MIYWIAGIILFFVLLALIKFTIGFSFAGEIQLNLKILFFNFKLFPLKEKPKKEPKSVAQKSQKKKTKTQKKKPKTIKPKPKIPLMDLINLAKDLLFEIMGKLGRYLKVQEYQIKLMVASPDAATTATLYGLACTVLSSLGRAVEKLKHTRKKGKIQTLVESNFLTEDYDLFLSIKLSIRLWQLISIGITGGKGLLKYRTLTKIQGENVDE